MASSNSIAKKLTQVLVDLAVEIVLVIAIFYILSLLFTNMESKTLLMISVFASIFLYRFAILPYALKKRAKKVE